MTLIQKLMLELKGMRVVCRCGAIEYPESWKPKTQKKAVELGLIRVCPDCTGEGKNYIKIN